jgi:hypothetical protein
MDIPSESVHDVDHDAGCSFLYATEESRGALEKVLLVCSSRVHELMSTKKARCCGLLRSRSNTCWLNDTHSMLHPHYQPSPRCTKVHADTYQLGLTWGGQEYSWSSARVIVTLIVGALLTLAFIIWQWKGTKYPLIPSILSMYPAISKSSLTNFCSAHLQIQDGQWRLPNHVRKRLELRRPSILHTHFLPAGIRILAG